MQNQDETVTSGNEHLPAHQQALQQQIRHQVRQEIFLFRQQQQQLLNKLEAAVGKCLQQNPPALPQQSKQPEDNNNESNHSLPVYTEAAWQPQHFDAGQAAMQAADEGIAKAMKSIEAAELAISNITGKPVLPEDKGANAME